MNIKRYRLSFSSLHTKDVLVNTEVTTVALPKVTKSSLMGREVKSVKIVQLDIHHHFLFCPIPTDQTWNWNCFPNSLMNILMF